MKEQGFSKAKDPGKQVSIPLRLTSFACLIPHVLTWLIIPAKPNQNANRAMGDEQIDQVNCRGADTAHKIVGCGFCGLPDS